MGGHFSELLSLDTGERALDLAADAEARASAARMAVLMEKGAASPGPGSGGAKDASNIGAPGSRGNSRQGGPGSGGGAGPGASPWNPGQLPTGICSAWLGNTANAGESLEKLANMIKEVGMDLGLLKGKQCMVNQSFVRPGQEHRARIPACAWDGCPNGYITLHHHRWKPSVLRTLPS